MKANTAVYEIQSVDYLTKFSAPATDAPVVAYGRNFIRRQVSSYEKIFRASRKTRFQEEIQLAVTNRRTILNYEADENQNILNIFNTQLESHNKNVTQTNDYVKDIKKS